MVGQQALNLSIKVRTLSPERNFNNMTNINQGRINVLKLSIPINEKQLTDMKERRRVLDMHIPIMKAQLDKDKAKLYEFENPWEVKESDGTGH